MTRFQLRIGHAPRTEFPNAGDEALGLELAARLAARLPQGLPRPALFCFFDEVVQIVDLPPLLAPGVDTHRAMASFASQAGVGCLAVVAVMNRNQRGRPVGRFGVVFLEWPDGRWWSSTRLLDAEGRPLGHDAGDVQRAVDGAPKPQGLGAWFRRARYEMLTLTLAGPDAVN